MVFNLKKLVSIAVILTASILLYFSCKRTPDPSAVISAKINGNAVTFSVEATDADSYSWDFGDGSESTEKNPVHVYAEFEKEYSVTLTVRGPGGTAVVTTSVTIPSMTPMEMLTGGENDPDGKTWKLDRDEDFFLAEPDAALTVTQVISNGVLSSWGFASAYQDKYIFKSDGGFSIEPSGQNIAAGLAYCLSKNIPNTPPSQAASEIGLTLITSFQAPTGLSFAFNESKDLQLEVCTDGENVTNVTIADAMTLTFSKDGFFGFKDWQTECVILKLTKDMMKAAVFISAIPASSPLKGKITNAFILTFKPAE